MIQFFNVNYVYNKGTQLETVALNKIDLTITENEFIGIIGHTGSGKSTLIQLMNRLEKPTGGRILYNGEDISKRSYNIRKLRKNVGVVFQYPEYQLFGQTVIDDVCFGLKTSTMGDKEKKERAIEVLKLVGISEKDYLKSPFELSGGNRKRVAIAGTLILEPDILILDEPTAALDPVGRSELQHLIGSIYDKGNITVIWISHDMNEIAKVAKRIIVMNDGEVILDGDTIEVFSDIRTLEKYGLKAPEIIYVAEELKKRGLNINLSELSAEGLAASIKQCVGGDLNG